MAKKSATTKYSIKVSIANSGSTSSPSSTYVPRKRRHVVRKKAKASVVTYGSTAPVKAKAKAPAKAPTPKVEQKKKLHLKLVAHPQPVDFEENEIDWEVVKLAKLGVHQKVIAARTGLTTSQVTYRLRQAGVRAKEYRDANSSEFRRVWSMADQVWRPEKAKAIRRKLDINHMNLLEAMALVRASRQGKLGKK